jgi:glycerophosphoryl diester phosphodiesterase
MTLPIRVPEHFRIIAHRGASAYAPENTAAAFQLAHEMGVNEVETDAQLTADGEVVLCHDTTLARYGHGSAVVEEMTWPEVAALEMGAWFSPYLYAGQHMWRLDDLFAAYGDRFTYHVELKGVADGLAGAVHKCLVDHGLLDNAIVTSFSRQALEAMRAVDANVRLGWLVETVTDEVLETAKALQLFQLCPRAAAVTSGEVEFARSAVSEVRAWGLAGSREEVQSLARRVVDAGCDGCTIDWPDWLSH